MDVICEAIKQRLLIQFYYTGDKVAGTPVVEPHMVAYNRRDHLALSAWFLGGATESGGVGWREYLLQEMSDIVMLNEQFGGPRPGYRSDGGKTFHNVQCAL
jgi:hypothetical protein